MGLTRRLFLKSSPVAALGTKQAVQEAAKKAELDLAGLNEHGITDNPHDPLVPQYKTRTFHTFSNFMNEFGLREVKEQSNFVDKIDPDILCLNLPLVTQVRMQRKKNYEYLIKSKQDWFTRMLKRYGKVEYRE